MEQISKFIILDLFCGAGGFSCGVHQNRRFNTTVALDFNAAAAKTFQKNNPNTNVITGDITDRETQERVISLCKATGVNMIIGGPPCQGFAMKGKKLGLEDERNFLFLEYLRIVEALSPEVFVIENVRQLLSSSNGWFKNEIIDHITKLGYYVDYGVLNAKNFGIPQSRERAFFICSKSRLIPLPIAALPKVTVKDAICDLAYLSSGEGEFETDYITEPMSDYQIKMRQNSKKLYNHTATNHSEMALKKLSLIPPEKGKECLPPELRGNQRYKTTWCRLKWNDISPTIDTRFDTPSNGTNSHPELNRSITPREAARIQSFPDNYIFVGNKSSICTQIGNAVPPLLAKAIADSIDAYYE